MADAPRVFISYSYDSDEHAARVLALADALSRDGCTVLFDRYVFPAPPDGWTAWMRQCLDPANCDFVLLVCTEGYLRRFEGREEPGAGRGVRREGRLVDSRLYEQDAQAARYIPILLDPADLRFVPRELFDHNRYVLGAFYIQDPGYEALYRHLTGQPATPAPQPGEVIILPPKPRPQPSPGPLPPAPAPPAEVVTPPPTTRPRAVDRAALVRTVSGLSPGDMAHLVTLVDGARLHVSRHGTAREQAAELIGWAESPTGPGLTAIQEALKSFR